MRLTIKVTILDYKGRRVGGQEFEATGPRASASLKELFDKLRDNFYDPNSRHPIEVIQAGKPLGKIMPSGNYADATGNTEGFDPLDVPQYDLRIQFPDKYEPAKLMTILYRESDDKKWLPLPDEIHTSSSVQSRLKILAATRGESGMQYCARVKREPKS